MGINTHSGQEFRHEPKVHGRLYELFHDSRFWAVVVIIMLVLGTFFLARTFANKLEGSFAYQPKFSQ